jgi:uncharacterized membrane protein
MNGAHWHLVLNHLPIIIPAVGLLIMFGGVVLKSEILKRAAYCIFILGAITAIAAFSTGEGAEEVVEELAGIDERMIKVHEESAEIFAILLYVLGGVSLLGLWASWKEKSFSNAIVFVSLLLTLIALFYAKETGTTGGEIRHTEIRNTEIRNTEIRGGNTPSVEHERDDD